MKKLTWTILFFVLAFLSITIYAEICRGTDGTQTGAACGTSCTASQYGCQCSGPCTKAEIEAIMN